MLRAENILKTKNMDIGFVVILSHAAYSTIQHISLLKTEEVEFSVVMELIAGLALCMLAGKFFSIFPKSNQSRLEKYMQTFVVCILVTGVALVQCIPINITYLDNAFAKGAVCVDGSLPSYYYAQGSGDGASNWIVFLQGGGWCAYDYCNSWIFYQKNTRTASMEFADILDNNQTNNPDFYNWNRVYVSYCDGASFLGDVDHPKTNPNLTSRGSRIFDTVMEDLQAKGMVNAEMAILAGTSAGGLATILHCDGFHSLIPNASRLKCIADAGFFIRGNTDDLPARETRVSRFRSTIEFHDLARFLPASCTSKMDPNLCMFPENLVNDIQTPLFLLQSSMDSYQMETGLVPEYKYNTSWTNCTQNVLNCTKNYITVMKGFRTVLLKTLDDLGKHPPSRGLFVHSCVTHNHFFAFKGWDPSPILGNKTIKKAIGDWYFDRSPVQEIDIVPNVEPMTC